MAAWEFAAGRYRHWAATLFCLPLVLIGVIFAPWRTALAFRAGLISTSLYESELDLNKPLTALRAEIATRGARRPDQLSSRNPANKSAQT